jgi:hypothetical protein
MSEHGMVEMAANGTMRLPSRRPLVVRVERGTVVVTRAADPDDHVVVAGEELRLLRGGLAVAWALAPTRLEVRQLVRDSVRRAWRSWRQGLGTSAG